MACIFLNGTGTLLPVTIPVPLAQRIARWTSNPKVLGSIPRWDETFVGLREAIFRWDAFNHRSLLLAMSDEWLTLLLCCFVSVVVITCASHAQGRRFEPGTKHKSFASRLSLVAVAIGEE